MATETNKPTFFGVIPAAGTSSRMGRSKLDLEIGDKTVLERVQAALAEGGIETTVVVIGPATRGHASLVHSPANTLILEMQTPDMRATVEAGLRWIRDRHQPAAQDWWFLAPADHGLLTKRVVRAVREAAFVHPGCIVVAAANGRRGHPVAAPWPLAGKLAEFPGKGVNDFFRANEALIVEVEVDADAFVDIDTVADFDRAAKQFATARQDRDIH